MEFFGENPLTNGFLGLMGGNDHAMCLDNDLFHFV